MLIGPHVHVNGAVVEDEGFAATRVSMLPGAVAGTRCELRTNSVLCINSVPHVNSVLRVNSRLLPGTIVLIGWIAVGDPVELFSPDRHAELWERRRELDFPGTVYRVPRGTSMCAVMGCVP